MKPDVDVEQIIGVLNGREPAKAVDVSGELSRDQQKVLELAASRRLIDTQRV